MANVPSPTSATDYATKTYVDTLIAAAGGAYTPPTSIEVVSGNNVTVLASGATDYLTWDTVESGSGLLLLTTPNTPLIVTTGIYAITARAFADTAMATNKGYQLTLEVGTGASLLRTGQYTAANSGTTTPSCSISGTRYCVAGDPITLEIQNFDSNSKDFFLDRVSVQRIT